MLIISLVVVILAFVYFISSLIRNWIKEIHSTKRKIEDSRERIEHSELENKRIGLVASALAKKCYEDV